PHWELGLSFASRPLGTSGGGVAIGARDATVTRPGGAPLCAAGGPSTCVFADMRYHLPDTLIAGVTWHALARLDLTLIARWLTLSQHDSIDIRLTGPAE